MEEGEEDRVGLGCELEVVLIRGRDRGSGTVRNEEEDVRECVGACAPSAAVGRWGFGTFLA